MEKSYISRNTCNKNKVVDMDNNSTAFSRGGGGGNSYRGLVYIYICI